MYRELINATGLFNSIEEVTHGQALKAADFTGTVLKAKWNGFKIPSTEYYWTLDSAWFFHELSNPESRDEVSGKYEHNYASCKHNINEIDVYDILVPHFNNKTTYALLVKCNLAKEYFKESRKILHEGNPYRGLEFHQGIMYCKRSVDIYVEVVNEILPLFEEDAREFVKFSIYSQVLERYSNISCQLLQFVVISIKNQIKNFSNYITPPELINCWGNAINEACAIFMQAISYKEKADRHEYNLFLEKKLTGVSYNKCNPYGRKYKERQWELYNDHIKPAKEALAQFHKLKPGGAPVAVPPQKSNEKSSTDGNSIFAENPSKVILWATQYLQASQNYISELYNSTVKNKYESEPLLETLKNYKSIYQSPKRSAPNPSVDQAIILREKKLIDKGNLIDLKDLSALAEFIDEYKEMLNLIKMRYSLSLNSNDNSYFNIFTASVSEDRKQYAIIIESYIENIIGGAINSAISSLIENKSISFTIDLELQNANIKLIVELIKSLQAYVSNKEYEGEKTTEMLDHLIAYANSIPYAEQISDFVTVQDQPTGLRRRYRRIEPQP